MSQTNPEYCSCLYYAANALSRLMTKIAEEEFAMTGLAPSYAFLLMSVNKNPSIQPTEISNHMQLTPSTVTRLIDKMEMKGFVERQSEGRTTHIYPTSKSLALDEKIKEAWQNLYIRYTTLLGESKAKELTRNVYEASTILET